MFTDNNYVLCKGESWGDTYKQLPINQLKESNSVIAVQLPECNVSFPVEIEEIERNSRVTNALAHRLHIVNTKGDRYTVEVIASAMEAFCRFSKFKRIDNIITWYQNFALVDWLGLPCKIESVEETRYTGNTYEIHVKDTNNLIVSGIVFRSERTDANDDMFDPDLMATE